MTVREVRERASKEAQAARDIKDTCEAEVRGMTQEEAEEFDKHCSEPFSHALLLFQSYI